MGFTDNIPPRRVNLSQQYYGVTVTSIGGNSPPYYLSFDPSGVNGGNWAPMSGFTGTIVLQGGSRTIHVIVQANQEIVVHMQ
jgi:hypothetical protein